MPRGQPRTLLKLHLSPSGNVGVAATAGSARLLSAFRGPLSLRKWPASRVDVIICWMRIRCQAAGSGFSTEVPACLRGGEIPPLASLYSPSPLGSNRLGGEFPLNCDLSVAVRVVGGRYLGDGFIFHMVQTCDVRWGGFFNLLFKLKLSKLDRDDFPAGFS